MPLNPDWHRAHPMPQRATDRQRADWHLEHARECGCRGIPARLLAQMRAWGVPVDQPRARPDRPR